MLSCSGTRAVVPFVALFGGDLLGIGASLRPNNATGGTGELVTGVAGSGVVKLLRMQDSFIPGLLVRGGPASPNQRGDSGVTGRAVTALIERKAACY